MRRSRRHRLSWNRFSRLVDRFIPALRNVHPYPEERFYASHTWRQEPYAEILRVRICEGAEGSPRSYRNPSSNLAPDELHVLNRGSKLIDFEK